MMKTYFLKLLILFLVILPLFSCNDPIFYMVHVETPLLQPLIGGSPTNFTVLDDKMYVASGKKIFVYGKDNNNWTELENLGGFVLSLAAAGNSLYALYLDNDNGKIKRYNSSGDSILDFNIKYIQSIYASANVLFICVRNNGKYEVYYLDEDKSSEIKKIEGLKPLDYMLNGVASDGNYFYLCAYSGIFYVEKDQIDSFSELQKLDASANFTGIINLNGDYVAAISILGGLFVIADESGDETDGESAGEITKTIAEVASFKDNRYSTGALALWYRNNTDETPSLLLVGRKEYYYSNTTGYTNGYVEIELDPATGRISGASFSEPGKNSPSSIDNNDRYVSSLGKKPVNYIIQTPASIDPEMTLFASTQQDGVWSYREREGMMQWNAEQ